MIWLLTGASHTGKTALARRILVARPRLSLSLDLLKMGCIRGGLTALTPEDDDALAAFLWPVVRGVMRTALENGQDLLIEGGYIPEDWEEDFTADERRFIRYGGLVMTETYIRTHWADILAHGCDAERRKDPSWTMADALADNAQHEAACLRRGLPILYIREDWEQDTARWPQVFPDGAV